MSIRLTARVPPGQADSSEIVPVLPDVDSCHNKGSGSEGNCDDVVAAER
jgi:hypothetical protein